MDIKSILKTLSEAHGVSGAEGEAAETALRFLKKYIPSAEKDKFGNVYGVLKKGENFPLILLDAHIDEIGMIVTYIDKNGFIKVDQCGRYDSRILPGQMVTVWGKEPLKGVISLLPPHVAKEEKKVLEKEDISIDTGYSKEELSELISLGDRITLDGSFEELLGDTVTGKALDDRTGVAAILYALELLKQESKFNIAVLFSSQEEVGGRGARIGAYRLNPDFLIAVDVSYGVCPELSEQEAGKMGGGPMIGISPYLDRTVFSDLKSIAEETKIPYQIEAMGRGTGTNADDIVISRNGVRGGLLSIPIRNMHTPIETVKISDIEYTGKLIAAYIEKAVI